MPEPDSLTPEERAEMARISRKLQESRPVCHRHFYAQVVQNVEKVKPESEASGLVLPDGAPAQEGGYEVRQVLSAGMPPCYAERCMLWDKRKQRCLDRSLIIKRLHGEMDPDDEAALTGGA